MGHVRTVALLGLIGCASALLHCGGDNSGSSGGRGQGGGTTNSDASPDVQVGVGAGDATVESGADADSPGAFDAGQVVDATLESGAGATGPGNDGSTWDVAVVPDAALPVLVCNQQPCAPAQFCGTSGTNAGSVDDAGEAAEADAPDAGDPSTADTGAPALACQAAVFSNVCANSRATLFFDAYDTDNAAAVTIGAALANACHLTTASPAAPPVDPTSGEPLTGIGNMGVIAGGSFGQAAMGYFDRNPLTDVVFGSEYAAGGVFNLLFTQRSGPGAPKTLAIAPYSATPTNTDYFLVELEVDPASGSLCLSVLGMSGQGTTAGAYYVANYLLANNAYRSSTKSWYLYYWVAADDAGVPSSADTFTLVGSGP